MKVGKAFATISLVIAVVMLLTAPATQGAMVRCMGAKCGGTGAVQLGVTWAFPMQGYDYLYELTVAFGDHINIFQVGTCDGNVFNYTNVAYSPNWAPALLTGGWLDLTPWVIEDHHSAPPVTAHGDYVGTLPGSPGPGPGSAPDGQCPYVVQWAHPAGNAGPATYYFGFNNINEPHDVGGTAGDLTLQTITWDEDWTKRVGMGQGPLHGPVPEPATLTMLALGSLALLRRRRR